MRAILVLVKNGYQFGWRAAGNMASPAYKRKVFDEDWYLETFDAAIGQSFTDYAVTNGSYAQ